VKDCPFCFEELENDPHVCPACGAVFVDSSQANDEDWEPFEDVTVLPVLGDGV
jgi:predicted amidophosphoribosyltransferase